MCQWGGALARRKLRCTHNTATVNERWWRLYNPSRGARSTRSPTPARRFSPVPRDTDAAQRQQAADRTGPHRCCGGRCCAAGGGGDGSAARRAASPVGRRRRRVRRQTVVCCWLRGGGGVGERTDAAVAGRRPLSAWRVGSEGGREGGGGGCQPSAAAGALRCDGRALPGRRGGISGLRSGQCPQTSGKGSAAESKQGRAGVDGGASVTTKPPQHPPLWSLAP